MLKLFNNKNEEFVEKLFIESSFLSKPISYEEAFDSYALNESLIKKVINKIIKNKVKECFKIWRNGKECGSTVNSIIDSDSSISTDIMTWFNNFFKNDKGCIFIGGAEQFDDELPVKFNDFLNPLLARHGVTFGGYTITLILGNYGYTPVGIHKDHTENCIFHFNLGPGSKRIYTWSDDQYNKLIDANGVYLDAESVIPIANEFQLDRNGFYFMPATEYHIAKADSFSVDVVVVISDRTNIRYTNDVITNFIDNCIASSENTVELERFDSQAPIEDIINKGIKGICIAERLKKLTLEDIIKTQIESNYLAMLSNKFWSLPPYREIGKFNQTTEWKRIHINVPFQIYFKISNDEKMAIYMRGRELVVNYHSGIVSLINILNASNDISNAEIEALCVAQKLSVNTVKTFIAFAIDCRALKIVE